MAWRYGGKTFVVAWAIGLALFPAYKRLWLGYAPVAVGMAGAVLLWRFRRAISAAIARPDRGPFGLLGMVIALLLRIGAAWYFPLAPANDHEMFYRLAESVARGTGFGWGYGPSAFFAPGLPLLLAAWLKLTGIGFWQAKVFGVVLGTSLVWVTYRFAEWAFGPLAGRWALLLAATSPTLVFYSVTVGYEPLLGIVLVGWTVLVERAVGTRPIGAWSTETGVLMGLGALIKPTCLLLPLVCLARWRAEGRTALTRAAWGAVIMLLVILPWTARNWLAFGSPVLVSTNGGVVLYAANNPESQGLAMEVAPLPGEHDEVSRDRIRGRAALAWMAAHPVEWTRLALAKIVYVWGTSSSIMSYVSYGRMPPQAESAAKTLLNVGWSALFVLCLAATVYTGAWQQRRFHAAALLLGYFFVVHLFFEALSRHHIAVMPTLVALAGAGLAHGMDQSGQAEQAA